jgi:hypothetical protein
MQNGEIEQGVRRTMFNGAFSSEEPIRLSVLPESMVRRTFLIPKFSR